VLAGQPAGGSPQGDTSGSDGGKPETWNMNLNPAVEEAESRNFTMKPKDMKDWWGNIFAFLCSMAKTAYMEFVDLSRRVIGCAIEVHRTLGPGLLESTYGQCLAHEL
jgi:hypothetical protein